ncbi:MAG: hypothetical protein Q4P20_12000 [Eubacteriales bacterium]|nr:hypothetical protein [Eubacteriales bacterium]
MKEFIFAALPWVLMGLALAVIAAAAAEARKKETEKVFGQGIAVGAGLGIVAGVILYACSFVESNAICLAIGPLLGMAVASLIPKKEQEK